MARPSLRQLSYLVAVADSLHFRKAAARVHVSQPTLSGQLAVLEARLGVKLVERRHHTLGLTPIGRDIAERARRILREVDDCVLLASMAGRNLGGTISLGVPPTLGPYLLPHVIPAVRARFPDLRLYIREDRPAMLVQGLRDGVYDLLLTSLHDRADDLTDMPLFYEELLLGVAQDHRLASKPQLSPADLQGEALLALGQGHHLYDQVLQFAQVHGAVLQADYEGTSLDTLRQMTAMQLGLSFFPALYVRSEMRNEAGIALRSFESGNLRRLIGLKWRCRSPREADFGTLADLIQDAALSCFGDLLIRV